MRRLLLKRSRGRQDAFGRVLGPKRSGLRVKQALPRTPRRRGAERKLVSGADVLELVLDILLWP
jgi:hypothetical protein